MIKIYPSKVSYGLLTFIFLVFYGPLIPYSLLGESIGKIIGGIVILSLVFAFILHMFFRTQYAIDNRKLTIKCGVFSYKPIDIEEIKVIFTTKSIISSPAPSFDRIQIKYGKYKEIILSPKDKFNFADDLTKINPNIKNKITE